MPCIYQNCKDSASQIKKENRTKGFSGSQLSLSPLNKTRFWLLVRAYSQVTILSLFPSPLLFKEGIAYKMWPLVVGVSLQLLLFLPLFLSLFSNAPNFFFFLFGSYLGNKVFCAPTLFELFASLGICTKAEEKRRLLCFTKMFMPNTFFSRWGESYPVGCVGGLCRYL